MTHRTLEQLEESAIAIANKLKAVRTEIRARHLKEITKLGTSYAKIIAAESKKRGGAMPTPHELAALLAPKPAMPAPKPAARQQRKPS